VSQARRVVQNSVIRVGGYALGSALILAEYERARRMALADYRKELEARGLYVRRRRGPPRPREKHRGSAGSPAPAMTGPGDRLTEGVVVPKRPEGGGYND
jgi:hypothetical protein